MANFLRDSLTGRWVLISPERLRRPLPPAPLPRLKKIVFKPLLVDRLAIPGQNDAIELHRHRYPAIKPFAPGKIARDQNLRAGQGQSMMLRFASGADVVKSNAKKRAAFTQMTAKTLKRLRVDKRVESLVMFRNDGYRGGASLAQPHHQIWAVPVPAPEESAEAAWVKSLPVCPTCQLARKQQNLFLAELQGVVLMLRPVPRFGAEMLVLPRRHVRSFAELKPAEQLAVTDLVAQGVTLIKKNFGEIGINEIWCERLLPGRRLHMRVELLPRINAIAGLELGTGIFLNPYAPEKVVKLLRARKGATL